MPSRADLIRPAQREAIAVSLCDLLNATDAVTAHLSDKVPGWLHEQLACERVQIYKERHGTWILAPLEE